MAFQTQPTLPTANSKVIHSMILGLLLFLPSSPLLALSPVQQWWGLRVTVSMPACAAPPSHTVYLRLAASLTHTGQPAVPVPCSSVQLSSRSLSGSLSPGSFAVCYLCLSSLARAKSPERRAMQYPYSLASCGRYVYPGALGFASVLCLLHISTVLLQCESFV